MVNNDFCVGFGAGLMGAAAAMGLHQDILGLDGYIDQVRAHWIPWTMTAPVEVVILVGVISLVAGANTRKV